MQESVEILEISPCEKPKNLKVYNFRYRLKGKEFLKELTKPLDIVKILIYNKDRDSFVLTQQYRPLLAINYPKKAYRIELCGGRCDKEGLSAKEVAIEEVLEETGYKVDDLEYITSFYVGSKISLFYVEVTDDMQTQSGGGVDEEDIEILYMPIDRAKEFIFNDEVSKRPTLAFSFCWFFNWKQ